MSNATRLLPLDQLEPDPQNERTRTDKEAISRLADSIRQHGILQRLLVRPANGRFMVVAGHRRLMAARAAGLRRVPVEVRDVDEESAKALQIVENLHREDVTPLDEAKAFDRLRSEDRSIEDVATLVGHSARYVAQRLSLINLVPSARKALQTGTIRLGTAYLLARIPNEKVQREALRQVDGSQDHALPVSRARRVIENHFEMNLANAAFDPEDESLVKGVSSCMTCPKRAGNQPLLFDGADREARCTDPVCFARKVRAGGRKLAKELEKQGHTVHGIKNSRETFFDKRYRGFDLKDNWVTPAQRASYETNLTWAKVAKEELAEEKRQTWVTHPDTGVLLRVISRSRAMKIAKEAGYEWAGARTRRKKTAAEKRKAEEQKTRRLAEQRVTKELLSKLDDFKLDDHVEWLVDAILDAARSDSLRKTCQAFGLKREQEVKTAYGTQKESWRDRLCRAVREMQVKLKPLFLQALMLEQGWQHYSPDTAHRTLRCRLVKHLTIEPTSRHRTPPRPRPLT